jgi:hypothetical protein
MERRRMLALVAVVAVALMISLAAIYVLHYSVIPIEDPTMTPAMALVMDAGSDQDELVLRALAIDRIDVGYEKVMIRVEGAGAMGNWTISLDDFIGSSASHHNIIPGYDMSIEDAQGDHPLTISPGDAYRLTARNGTFAPGDWWVFIVYAPTDGAISLLRAMYPWH